jgi:hypothetical protein
MSTPEDQPTRLYERDIPTTARRYRFGRPQPAPASARLVQDRGGPLELQLNVDDAVFDLRLDWHILSTAVIQARRIAKAVER